MKFSALTLCLFTLTGFSSDWPQFLGPNQTGAVNEEGLFKDGFSLELAWKEPLGPGFSSILAAGGMVYAMHGTEEHDVLSAFHAKDGALAWRYEIGPLYKANNPSVDGPLSTPVYSDGTIFGLAAKGTFFAVNAKDGKEIWRTNIVEGHGAKVPYFGLSSSPIAYRDLVILHIGGQGGKAIGAFHKKNGELKWSIGDDGVSYQSPTLAIMEHGKQLLVPTSNRLMGLDPTSGQVLWETPLDKSTQAIAVDRQQVLVNTDGGFNLYKIAKEDSGFTVNQAWRTTYISLDWDMPVVHQGFIYGYKKDFLTCIDGKRGETVWKTRNAGRGMSILADGHLAILDREGNFRVVAASPDGFNQKAELKVLDGQGLTEPSYAGGTFYVRNYKEIAAVRVKR